MALLQKIRDHFGKAVNINLVLLTASHNAKQKKAAKVQPSTFMAAGGPGHLDRWRVGGHAGGLETLLPGKGGRGRYHADGFVHVDVREVKTDG